MYPSSFFSNQYFPQKAKAASASDVMESNRTKSYCGVLSNNVNALNFCKQKKCYAVNPNSKWIKNGVNWQDNAMFSINNNISGNTQYFGGEYNRLHYASYTPYQYDPTWNEPQIHKYFPNGIKGRPGTFTVTDL